MLLCMQRFKVFTKNTGTVQYFRDVTKGMVIIMQAKEIRVGVIGCGAIGREHIKRLNGKIVGTRVVAVSDYFQEAADNAAEQYGVRSTKSGEALINDPEVDAVVIASSDPSHAGYVLESIQAGKYVFCEKPLAQTAADCEKIMQAEIKHGKRLVQVGFMRRYDSGYTAMKEIIDSGRIGEPLLIHAAHRNVSQAPDFETNRAITQVAIHELDISRWLLDDEYQSAQVLDVKQNSLTEGDFQNPIMILLQTKKNARIDVEVQCTNAYAYDIQCQVVGEKGTVNLPDPSAVVMRSNANCGFELMTDWAKRFIEAYDIEFQHWADALQEERVIGPSSWDGYVACVTADALIKSRQTKMPEPVITIQKNSIYE